MEKLSRLDFSATSKFYAEIKRDECCDGKFQTEKWTISEICYKLRRSMTSWRVEKLLVENWSLKIFIDIVNSCRFLNDE